MLFNGSKTERVGIAIDVISQKGRGDTVKDESLRKRGGGILNASVWVVEWVYKRQVPLKVSGNSQ